MRQLSIHFPSWTSIIAVHTNIDCEDTLMDFIIKLPKTRGFQVTFLVIDRPEVWAFPTHETSLCHQESGEDLSEQDNMASWHAENHSK